VQRHNYVVTDGVQWALHERAVTGRAISCSSHWSCSKSSPRSPRGLGSTSCSTTACSRRMPAGERAWLPTAHRWSRRAPRPASLPNRVTTRRRHRNPGTGAWADLMRRAFDIDVLACPRCGGRLRLIATVEDPDPFARSSLPSRCRERGRIERRRPARRWTQATPLRSTPERHDAGVCSLQPGAVLHLRSSGSLRTEIP
jgi:hypothetical protein